MHRRGEAGTTLVELLVGLALFGLIAMTSLAALQGGGRLSHGGRARAEAIQRIEAVHGTLRRLLEDTANLADAGQDTVAFAGGATQLAWVGRAPSAAMPAGLYALHLTLQDDRLVFGWRAFDAAQPLADQPPEDSVTVLDGIAGATLTFFGDNAWQARWVERPRLPRLLRLDVAPSGSAAWRWPPLVVAIGPPLDGA